MYDIQQQFFVLLFSCLQFKPSIPNTQIIHLACPEQQDSNLLEVSEILVTEEDAVALCVVIVLLQKSLWTETRTKTWIASSRLF